MQDEISSSDVYDQVQEHVQYLENTIDALEKLKADVQSNMDRFDKNDLQFLDHRLSILNKDLSEAKKALKELKAQRSLQLLEDKIEKRKKSLIKHQLAFELDEQTALFFNEKQEQLDSLLNKHKSC